MTFLFTDSTYIINKPSIDVPDIANIVIATFSLGLAYYIFVYQRNKDRKEKAFNLQKEQNDRLEASRLQEQNIRLQWFKELVIQPHLSHINDFFSDLHALQDKITINPLTDQQKIELVGYVKTQQASLRKSFVDVLLGVNPELYNEVIANLDKLTDDITNTIFNQSFDLTHKATFEREIGGKITYSRNDLIKKIYNYKGI